MQRKNVTRDSPPCRDLTSGATTQRWLAERRIHGPRLHFTSSRYKTAAALLKPPQQKRRTQHQRMATISPFLLQRFQMFSEHCCSHRLRADICRVVPFLSFLCANLARVHTFNQPLHGTMQMSNPSCSSSFHDTLG